MSRTRVLALSLGVIGAVSGLLADHPGPQIDADADQLRIAVPSPYRLNVEMGRIVVEWGPGNPTPLPPAPNPGPTPAPVPPTPSPSPIGPLQKAGFDYARSMWSALHLAAQAVESGSDTTDIQSGQRVQSARNAAAKALGQVFNDATATYLDGQGRIIDRSAYAKVLREVAYGMSLNQSPASGTTQGSK